MHHLQNLAHVVTSSGLATPIVLVGALLVLGAVGFLLSRTRPALLISVGIGLEIFSGWWKSGMGIPLPLDRVLIVLGLAVLVWRGMRSVSDRRLVLSPIHVLFVVIVAWVVCSAIAAGTLTTSAGFYAILDRLGVFPYLMFTLAPLVFGDRRSRDTLLGVLVVVGLYLSAVSIAEGLHVDSLVLPSYILDPHLGIHFGRARGPFLEAVANGLCIFMCGVAAAVALSSWRDRFARLVCIAVMVLGPFAIVMTLTRTNWLAAIVGVVAAMLPDRRLRRFLPPLFGAGALVVLVALVADPHLRHRAVQRAGEVSPLWDRYNLTFAALRASFAHPLFGLGWATFPVKGVAYFRQAPGYPINGVGQQVPNAFLERLVENGVPLTLLWVWALVTGLGGAMVRRCPSQLYAWRLGLIAIVAAWFVAANLDPMAYPLPNLLIWLWAGIVAADFYSCPRSCVGEDVGELGSAAAAGSLVG